MTGEAHRPQASVAGLVALGIGSMVGAGIFALLGEAARLAGPAVWLSFLAAGVIAMLTGHSFVRLAVRYPSRGGLVEYLTRAYGAGTFSGGCSILFYISQLIGMAMISLAFGKFSARLLDVQADLPFWERILACSLIVALSALQLAGSRLVSVAQRVIVLINLAALTAFAVALTRYVDTDRLQVATWPEPTSVLGSLSLTFMAFTGFAVISNAAERARDPVRDLPRAMYLSIGAVTVLYVSLALVVAGTVDADTLRSSGATLIASATRAHLGEAGFYVLLVVAVAATVTCLNGGLFGVTGVTYTLAEKGQLPSRFKAEIGATSRGLTISAVIAIIMVNFFDLTTVASLGAATSLMVYALVNVAALRLVDDGGLSRVAIHLSIAACVLAIVVWAVHTYQTKPQSLLVFLAFLVVSFVAESALQRVAKRRILPQVSEGADAVGDASRARGA